MHQSPEKNRSASPQPVAADQLPGLLAGCRRAVFLYAMSLLHNADDAEDVVQETEVILWKKFHQYQPGTDFQRWACGIARIEALNLRQRRSRQGRLFSDRFFDMLAARSLKPEELLEARQEALDQCLGKLSAADRSLIVRRYCSGAKTRSVAEALGRSVQGTRRSLQRIREALAACVKRTLAGRRLE